MNALDLKQLKKDVRKSFNRLKKSVTKKVEKMIKKVSLKVKVVVAHIQILPYSIVFGIGLKIMQLAILLVPKIETPKSRSGIESKNSKKKTKKSRKKS